MIAKLSHNAKAACNLLVFNALCIVVLSLFFPFSLAWNVIAAVFNTFKDYIQPLIVENKNIVKRTRQIETKKTGATRHQVQEVFDVRNN